MEGRPRSIYAVPRPLRIAYLVASSQEGIEPTIAIISYLKSILAGRYSPIIATDGSAIAQNDLTLLIQYDPDIVKAMLPLNESLVLLLGATLSPFAIEAPYTSAEEMYPVPPQVSDTPLSINNNVDNFSHIDFLQRQKPQLVDFIYDENIDGMLRRFLVVNFGATLRTARPQFSSNTNDILTIPVNSWADLEPAFKELNSYKPRTFAGQRSTLPNSFPDTEHDNTAFHVVVGNALEDILLAWNRIFNTPQEFRTIFRTMWIPTTLYEDDNVAKAFALWAKTVADLWGFGNQQIAFTGASITTNEVTAFAERFGSHISATYLVQTSETRQEINWRPNTDTLGPNASLYPVVANRAIVKVSLPSGPVAFAPGSHWMIDLHVEMMKRASRSGSTSFDGSSGQSRQPYLFV